MDINAILAAMNAEGYNVKDVTADDLSTHLAALTEARRCFEWTPLPGPWGEAVGAAWARLDSGASSIR